MKNKCPSGNDYADIDGFFEGCSLNLKKQPAKIKYLGVLKYLGVMFLTFENLESRKAKNFVDYSDTRISSFVIE